MWKALNHPLFGTQKPTLVAQWREPYLCRLRLHRDYLMRLGIAFAIAVTLASIFFIAGFAETKDVASGLIAAGFGFFFMGAIAGMATLFSPEAAWGSKVEVFENGMRRSRGTFSFYGPISTKEVWDLACTQGAYAFAHDLGVDFSVLLLTTPSRTTAVVCVPVHVDFDGLIHHLRIKGAALEQASLDEVQNQPPYGRLSIVASSVIATLAVAAAIAVAMAL
ncbi:MAG: hypothetical protein SFV81_24200 [Pirellulaceae bacterium]|nr:hypothetical protein [Pirellulaceae bacterium]